MSNRLLSDRARWARFFIWMYLLACGSSASSAQQRLSWEQIRDLFLNANPTIRAQAQSVQSNRGSEITAGLRPNPQFQNDTTSATIGIYQEVEIGESVPRASKARSWLPRYLKQIWPILAER